MRAELDLIPHAVIHPDRICIYNEINWYPSRPTRKSEETEEEKEYNRLKNLNGKSKENNGILSKNATRKLSRAIDYLILTSVNKKALERLSGKIVSFRIAFITLTLPASQVHPDSTIIKECLNQFLTECRQAFNVTKYVWRAERQKNGNVHFHILTDVFIPYYELRNRWNRILQKLRYVDRYQEKNGSKQPNSTDVHATRKIKDLKKYLTKYLTKAETASDSPEFQEKFKKYQSGRIWGCSQNLSDIKGADLIIDNEIADELTKIVERSKCKRFVDTYFSVFYLNYSDLSKFGSDLLFKYFSDYLIDTFNFNLQVKI